MTTRAVRVELLSGTYELRPTRHPGEESCISVELHEHDIRSALINACDRDALAVWDLCAAQAHELILRAPAQIAQGLMQALRWGALVLARPGGARNGDDPLEQAWAAYHAFRDQFGREMVISMRVHRLVARQSADEVRRDSDFDVVPAEEASATILSHAKNTRGRMLQGQVDLLAKHMVDLRTPANKPGFVLLRAPIVPASRHRAAEEVFTPAKLKELKREKERGTHSLHLEYVTDTGHSIIDEEGFILVWPDGREEALTLDNGRLRRNSVDPGEYEVRLRAIVKAGWELQIAHPYDEVPLFVEVRGFTDGTPVSVRIFPLWAPPHAEPIAELSAQTKGGRATCIWAVEQKLGAWPYDKFHFEAAVGTKRAWSGVLSVRAHEPSSVRGVQERLRALGYEPGPAADAATPELENALKQFQEDHPPLPPTGNMDPITLDILDDYIP